MILFFSHRAAEMSFHHEIWYVCSKHIYVHHQQKFILFNFFTTFSNCLFEQKHVSSGFIVNFRSKTPLIFLFPKVAKLCYFLLGSNSERLYTQWEKTAGVKETQKVEENVKWFSYQVRWCARRYFQCGTEQKRHARVPSQDQIHSLKGHMVHHQKTRGKAMVRTMHRI